MDHEILRDYEIRILVFEYGFQIIKRSLQKWIFFWKNRSFGYEKIKKKHHERLGFAQDSKMP